MSDGEPPDSGIDHETMRHVIVAARLHGEEPSAVGAHMLSQVDRAEREGKPCPPYPVMRELARKESGVA